MIYKSEDLIRDVSNDTDFSPDIVESVYYGIFENLLFKIKHPNKHLAFNLRDFGTFLFRRKKLIETQKKLQFRIENDKFPPTPENKEYIDNLVILYEKYDEDREIPFSLGEKKRMEKKKNHNKKSI